MPGYKGHLAGGCAAFGITLTAIAACTPAAMSTGTHAIANMIPAVLHGIQSFLGITFPPLIMGTKQLLASCIPSVILVIEWFLCAIAGALFPDIDIKSKGQKWFYGVLFLVMIALIGNKQHRLVSFVAVAALVPMLVNHRGLFHRLWFVIALPFGLWFWLSFALPHLAQMLFFHTLFFVVGAISHLWLDYGFKRMIRKR